MAATCSSDVIYIIIARKMKTPLTTNAIGSPTESRSHVSFGLMFAGIVTAVLCVLAFLHDTYSTSERLPNFFESSSISGVSDLVTSASALVSHLGDSVVLF